MKPSIETLAMIRDYARGELTEQERARVEDLLAQQPELREEVLLAQLLVDETARIEQRRLMQTVQEAGRENAEPSSEGSSGSSVFPLWKRPWFRLAAASVLLLLAFGIFWYTNDTPPEDGLASFREEAYSEPPISEVMRRGISSSSWLLDANQQLQTREYKQCLSVVESIPPSDSLYLYALLLEGHSYYRLQQYDRSIQAFEKLLEQYEEKDIDLRPPKDDVRWSRILAALAKWETDNTPDNRQALDRLLVAFLEQADRTDRFYEQAQQLQRLLN